jgi:hypothetical protein
VPESEPLIAEDARMCRVWTGVPLTVTVSKPMAFRCWVIFYPFEVQVNDQV